MVCAAMLCGCAPAFVNQPKNDLRLPLAQRVINSNSRTESFVRAAPLAATSDRPLRASDGDDALARARAGTTGPEVDDADGYFVGLAISGGGSRSANFAAACMFQLERLGMLQKVDCISAVSGGTLAATYYCSATPDEWNTKNVQEKLSHAFATDSIDKVLLPWNLIGLMLGRLTRTDLLADVFADDLFSRDQHRLTFADLRQDRPRLLLNSTDLQSGRRFIFDNSTFDLLNSDLNKYPLAYAVSASSAVPGVILPVTIRDFSTTFPQYFHLMDGGVVDNLGVQSLVESYEAQIQKPKNPYPHGAILIVIDAGTQASNNISSEPILGGIENLIAGINLSSTLLVNRASSATLSETIIMHALGSYTAEDLRNFIEKLQTDHYVEMRDSKHNLVRVIHLSLSQVGELSNGQFGAEVNGIDTNFNIGQDEAYELYKSAEILFSQRFDARVEPLVAEMNRAISAATQLATYP
jgi:predicted acylesterase/phospholipase RssA